MSLRSSLTVPTSSSLSPSLRLPTSHPSTSKPLSKLSRPSLLSLAQEWLRIRNQSTCGPFLGEEELDDESIYSPARTLQELREVYGELALRKGGKREVLDRILEGDWRHGLSLRQLAMVDVQHLLDHPTSLRWTAFKLAKVVGSAEDPGYETATLDVKDELPRFHGPTYLTNLQREIGPLMKTHYHLNHLSTLPVTVLRIYVHDSPYNSQTSLLLPAASATSKTLFVIFPDYSPFVYISSGSQSSASSSDGKNFRHLVIEALPKAFSRPKERWALKPTSLTARSLSALVASRGGGNSNSASGGWSMFAEGSVEQSPLRPSIGLQEEAGEDASETTEPASSTKRVGRPSKRLSDGAEKTSSSDLPAVKRRKMVAQRRFGNSALLSDDKGIERLDIRFEDSFYGPSSTPNEANDPLDSQEVPEVAPKRRRGRPPASAARFAGNGNNNDDEAEDSQDAWRPDIEITFHGTHVFAGIRQLVEAGVIDGEKMPGWMTGEEGVSIGVVKDGRIRGNKGSGV